MNYKVRLLDCSYYGMNTRKVGDIVYAHIYDDGHVLLFDPHNLKENKTTFDVIFDSVLEAKKYATCICKTNFDVKGTWNKMMSDRYWG